MSSSAPIPFANSNFSLLLAAAITLAPMAFAISMAVTPTPPAAPRTKIVSPSLSFADCLSA